MANLSNLFSKNKNSNQNAGASSGGEKQKKADTTGHDADTSTSSNSTTVNKNKNGSQGTTTSTTGSTTPPGSPPKNPIKCKPEPPVKFGITTTITAGGHNSSQKRSSHTKAAELSSLSFHSSLNPDPDPAAAAASLALIQDKVNSAASALQNARAEERDAWKQLCAVDANHGLTSNSLIPAMWYPSYRKAFKRHQKAREEVEAAKREMERAEREFGQF